jgi:hypothetical protein
MSNVAMAYDSVNNPFGAMAFNGNNSYVSVNNNDGLNPVAALTIVAWIKQTNTDNKCIISKDYIQGYELAIVNGVLKGYIKNTTALTGTINIGTTAYKRVVFAYKYVDGISNTQKIYVNGTLDNSNTTAGTLTTNSYNLRLGTRVDASLPFNGQMYDVRIYNREWSQAEVTADYNGQLVSNTGLVASWKPYQPSTDIDFYLHTHRPKSLTYRRDESGSIYELDLYPGNGLLYHGRLFHCNPIIDSDSDLVPDVLNQNLHFSTQDGQIFTTVDGALFDTRMSKPNGSLFQFLQSYGMIV